MLGRDYGRRRRDRHLLDEEDLGRGALVNARNRRAPGRGVHHEGRRRCLFVRHEELLDRGLVEGFVDDELLGDGRSGRRAQQAADHHARLAARRPQPEDVAVTQKRPAEDAVVVDVDAGPAGAFLHDEAGRDSDDARLDRAHAGQVDHQPAPGIGPDRRLGRVENHTPAVERTAQDGQRRGRRHGPRAV
jgi:hypothetical protein